MPTATPKMSAGTKPPTKSSQSQTARQRRPLQLAAVLEAHRTQDERAEHDEHGEIEAGEGHGIDHRPGGENGAGAEDQPHLIAFPDRSDRVDGDAALTIGAGDEGQQDADAEIETVHDGKADEQHAEQQPPDDTQGRIIEEMPWSFSRPRLPPVAVQREPG